MLFLDFDMMDGFNGMMNGNYGMWGFGIYGWILSLLFVAVLVLLVIFLTLRIQRVTNKKRRRK